MILAANWKMYLSGREIEGFLTNLQEINDQGIKHIICPSFNHIHKLKNYSFSVGAQDCSSHEKGAFTSEISADSLVQEGVEYVIIGHSERRQYHKETSDTLTRKVVKAQKAGLKVIFCVGEPLIAKDQGIEENYIADQLQPLINENRIDMSSLIVAYEPVWAIGSGRSANPDDAEKIHQFIKEKIPYKGLPVIYGGSVKPDNVESFLRKNSIDGVLVGSASADVNSWNKILSKATSLHNSR